MSVRTPINCSSDNILKLEKQFLDELGSAFTTANNQILEVEELMSELSVLDDLEEGDSLFQDIISNGSGNTINNVDELPELFGIDRPQSVENDERYIFDNTPLVMSTGIFFKKENNLDNIEVLRRIYNSVGKDFSKVEQIYSRGTDSSYRSLIETIYIEQTGNDRLTLEDIRNISNNQNVISSDYTEIDKGVLLLNKKPLLVEGLTNKEIPTRFGYNINYITNTILHNTTAKNTTSAINNWINKGFSEILPSILDGEDPSINPDLIVEKVNVVKNISTPLISELEIYKERIDKIDLESTKFKILNQLYNIKNSVVAILSVYLTEISVISEFDTLSKLRLKLSDDEIDHLLSSQRYVLGIDLGATEDEIINLIESSSVGSGSNLPSTTYLNKSLSLNEENKNTLLLMISDIDVAISKVSDNASINSLVIDSVIGTLIVFNSRTIMTTSPASLPVAGYPSFNSPTSIINERINMNKNFDINLKIGAIDDALKFLSDLYDDTVGAILKGLIGTASNVLNSAIQMVNSLRDKINSQILPLKRKLSEFISKYLTLIGSGNFNSSVIKCAINFNASLDIGILDALEALIIRLSEKINALIGQLAGLIVGIIEDIICPALSFVERIIGSGNSYLPSFCAINSPVLLPDEVIDAMANLRRMSAMQNVAFTSFNDDLIKVRATVSTAPDRLSSFRNDAQCMGQTASSMIETTLASVRF